MDFQASAFAFDAGVQIGVEQALSEDHADVALREIAFSATQNADFKEFLDGDGGGAQRGVSYEVDEHFAWEELAED